uniref:Activin_recp domain-containing protein n=1 Tax=Panagrellus redivivus TaxID=6233 RepID=A0A7E4UZ03_PANRE
MLKLNTTTIALILLSIIVTSSALECFTGYSVVRGQASGTTKKTCSKSSDQCFKAKANVNLLNKLKLAGCSTFRCMFFKNKCTNQTIAGQNVEICCCNDRDLCNGPEELTVASAANKVKDFLTGGALGKLGSSFG